MSESARILAFSGSARRASYNSRLLDIPVRGARDTGAEVTVINLRDFPLPIFDEDMESSAGLPENAQRLKELFVQHQGLLIAAPEYNSSITPLLKNTIDWVSRGLPGEVPLAAYRNKVAALFSASPGALGGLRGLVHVRAILGNIGVLVLPAQLAIPKAHDAFHDDGSLKDAKLQRVALEIGRTLSETVNRLAR